MKKANNTSEKGMPDGKTYTINVYEPTFSEWVLHFCQDQTNLAADANPDSLDMDLARFASDYNGHKIANNLATALKNAFKRVMDPEAKKESETYAKALSLVQRVKDGDVFDLRDFVSAKKREKKTRPKQWLDVFDQVWLLIKSKWDDATEEKRQGVIDQFELDVEVGESSQEALAAFEAKYEAPPRVELETLM